MHLIKIVPDPESKAAQALLEYDRLLKEFKNHWAILKSQRVAREKIRLKAVEQKRIALAEFRKTFFEFNEREVKIVTEFKYHSQNNVERVTLFEVRLPYVC